MPSCHMSLNLHLREGQEVKADGFAYVLSHQYVIKQEAETEEEPRRIFFLLDRYYWYECVLEKTQPTAGPMTFIASFIYFARSDEDFALG